MLNILVNNGERYRHFPWLLGTPYSVCEGDGDMQAAKGLFPTLFITSCAI